MSRGLNLNNTENIIADNISIVQGNNVVDIFDVFLAKDADISVDLSNYYNKSEIDTSLGLKFNASDIASYYTKTQTDALIPDLTNYYNKTEIDTSLGLKFNASDIASYYTKTQVDALIPDLTNYYTKTNIDNLVYSQSEIDTALNTKQTIDAAQTKVRLGTSSTFKDLTKSATGTLVWGSNDIVEAPTLNSLETYTIAQLATKQDTLTAGTNITISANNTISATGGGSSLDVAVFGSLQSGVERLDFLTNEATLDGTTLLIGPPRSTRLGLYYASTADTTDLEKDSGGGLTWGGSSIAMAADHYTKAETDAADLAYLQFSGNQTTQLLTEYYTKTETDTMVAPVSSLVNSVSGVSLGDAHFFDDIRKHRMACFELSNGSYFYGIGLYNSSTTSGIGIWGGTDAFTPDQGSGGSTPHLFCRRSSSGGGVAINSVSPVSGYALTVNGALTATTKSFDIPHPDPEKTDWRLRHWCVESDTPGGVVMYRKQLKCSKAGTYSIAMPSWFTHLVKNTLVFCSPYKHFGQAWGEQVDSDIHITTSKGGTYNVLVTSDRADMCATNMCPQEVEYITPEPVSDDSILFPN